MAKKETAHRPSQANQEYVTTADGRKVRNTAYKPSAKGTVPSVADISKETAIGDFASSPFGHLEYSGDIIKDFIEEDGIGEVRGHIVSEAVLDTMIQNAGNNYSQKDIDSLNKKFEKRFDEFAKTEAGADVIRGDLSAGLVNGFELIDEDDSSDIDIAVDEEEMGRFVQEGGIRRTSVAFKNYMSEKDRKFQNDEAFENLIANLQAPDDDYYEKFEEARLEDANERGYDSIEEYEEALEDAQFQYAEGRGFEVARQQASFAAVKDYFRDNPHPGDTSEMKKIGDHYNKLFDQFSEEGYNSESIHNAILTSNSSYEVVDVNNGDLVVDDNQEAEWASGFEFNQLREDFTEYARKHPFKG